jgi:pimeloyl-ACP methyl ester carboxylesterase
MPTINVNGAELTYEEYGSGPEIVVSAQQWNDRDPDFRKMLAQPPHNYHVYCLVLRAPTPDHEASKGPYPTWYATWAEDVYAFIKQLNLGNVVYTGSSHGGGIGWELAVDHPDVIKAIVPIVGVPRRLPPSSAPTGRASLMAARNDRAALRKTQEPLYAKTNDPERAKRREAFIERGLDRVLNTPQNEADQPIGVAFPHIHTQEELMKLIEGVTVPVLALVGAQDPWATPESAVEAIKHTPGARLVVFQDESHMLSMESPDKVVREFTRFVDELNGKV